jgi:GDP-L-fucose synthase
MGPGMHAKSTDFSRVWVTGHKGLVGSAVVRALRRQGVEPMLVARSELDLRDEAAVLRWMQEHRPSQVFHVGAKVGGIRANSTMRAEFLHDNLRIQSSVIHGAWSTGVSRLVFVATNCTYPTTAHPPLSEDMLLTGPLEPNIRSYAIAKLAGIEMCLAYRDQYGCDFLTVIPPNMYGPGDNFHPEHSHVIAGIMGRMHAAKISGASEMAVWGDGSPRREILHADDLADAMLLLMQRGSSWPVVNVGYGEDFSIAQIAEMIRGVTGFEGRIDFDTSKPNGSKGKLLDSSRIRALGWTPAIHPTHGLKTAYDCFLNRLPQLVST